MPRKIYKTEEEKKNAKKLSIEKYRKKSCKIVQLRFFKKRDKDVIEKLDSVENKTDYIRQLILNDINK